MTVLRISAREYCEADTGASDCTAGQSVASSSLKEPAGLEWEVSLVDDIAEDEYGTIDGF